MHGFSGVSPFSRRCRDMTGVLKMVLSYQTGPAPSPTPDAAPEAAPEASTWRQTRSGGRREMAPDAKMRRVRRHYAGASTWRRTRRRSGGLKQEPSLTAPDYPKRPTVDTASPAAPRPGRTHSNAGTRRRIASSARAAHRSTRTRSSPTRKTLSTKGVQADREPTLDRG